MKKLALLACFSFCLHAYANEWLDITSRYVTNPSYLDNSKDGWTYSCSASGTDTNYGCQEVYNGTCNVSQTITGLTNGTYRVGVQGFYRNGAYSATELTAYQNGTDTRTAYLFANSNQSLLSSIYAETENYGYSGAVAVTDGDWWSGTTLGYVPNNMESASLYFAAGKYSNSIEVSVTNGTLKFGILNNTSVSGNWLIFTNWTLEYYCTPVTLTRLSFDQTSITLGKGETCVLQPQFTPTLTSASKYSLSWTSSNTSVAAVGSDGEVRAVDSGTCTITCTDAVSGLKATATVKVSSVDMSSANVIINEIQVSNIDQFIDPSFNYGGWVELYNPTSQSVFLGNAYVKDHKGRSFRLPYSFGSIPANGYRNIWFDHNSRYGQAPNQVPFKLDRDSGTVIICNASGQEIVRQSYAAIPHRCSYARTTDGGSTWGLSVEATPESSNDSALWGVGQLEAPVVSKQGCLFTGTLLFTVDVPAGCKLVYTTDGSTPTLGNGTVYNNTSANKVSRVFTNTVTCYYRFRLYKDGVLPSEVVTRSFIYNTGAYNAPVVSVVANEADLMGDDYGVYVKGNGNGRPGNGQSSACNWNMEWERAVNFEYMVPDNNYKGTAFSQLVDFEMCGGWSRAWEPHSFKLKANKLYGEGNLDYTFFDDKPYSRNKSLQLRNGGNDTYCRFKDAALQEIVRRSGIYVDIQAWQPVHVFINGEYKKVLNMREPNNKHNAFANYGIDPDYVDQFEISPDSGYVQKAGTKDAFSLWYQKSQTCGSVDADYQYICDSLVDIEEYANYMAVEFYLGATDWPQNNVKGFRAYQDDENGHPAGKFHFVLFDLDGTFATTTPFSTFAWKQNYTFDTLYGIDEDGNDITGQHYTREIEFVTIFLNMIKNADFKKRFADAYCLVAGSVFNPERCQSIIQEMQTIENAALSAEGGSCSSTASTLTSKLSSSYQSTMVSQLQSYLSLTGGRTVTLSSDAEGAVLLLNGQEVPTGNFSGTLFGTVTVQALAPAGYRFAGWSSADGSSASYQNVFPTGSAWNYSCGTSLDGTTWSSDMSSYSSGNAPLGYGKSGLNTTLTSNLATYYFGKTFTLTSGQLQSDLQLSYTVDDGFIIYVNGAEAARYNMPSGTVTSESFATTYANGNPDTGTLTLSKSLFKTGTNTICVEVHNNSANSSDIYWDCSLSYRPAVSGNFVSNDSIYTLGSSAVTLTACFEALPDTAQSLAALNYPIRVNEVGAANDVFVNEYWKKNDWIELYNNTDVTLDVAGLCVSDNAKKPTKYVIPGNFSTQTSIPAHGRLVIWADKLESEDQIHTGFKLGNDKDALVLVCSTSQFEALNETYFSAHPEMRGFVDALTYDVQQYNQSVGRYPDGGNAIFRMNRPSIGSSNLHCIADDYLGLDKGLVLTVDPTGIGEVTPDVAPDEAVFQSVDDLLCSGAVFYDLQGRRVQHPQSGQLLLRGRSVK